MKAKIAQFTIALISLAPPIVVAQEISEEKPIIRYIAPGLDLSRNGLYEVINLKTRTIVYVLREAGKETQMQVVPFGLLGAKGDMLEIERK